MAITITLNRLPTSTGIYRFFDASGQILYVGKAVNLRERLRSYRQSQSKKIQQLVQEATKLDWELTSSEATALLREAELIKRHQPRYNTLLRDDSQYFYVKFTNDQLPKVLVTHQPQKLGIGNSSIDHSQFIGPFTEGRTLRLILKTLRRFLPFCTCTQSHQRECLNAHLDLCPGWCCQKDATITPVQRRAYQQTLRKLQQILDGDLVALKQKLLGELTQELKRNKLERATQLKHEIEAINALARQQPTSGTTGQRSTSTERLKVLRELQQLLKLTTLPQRIEAYDCSHFGGTDRVGTMVAFHDGQHAPRETRYFKIRGNQLDDLGMIKETLTRRLSHPEWPLPNLILVDGGITQFRCARAVLAKTGHRIPLIGFAKPLRQLYHHVTKPPLALAGLPAALRLFLEEVDARVHRAAIGFHRRIRSRKISLR